MRQKITALFFSLLAAIYVAHVIDTALPAAPPRLAYNQTATLTGTLTREFDMAFVDASLVPIKDPALAERAAGEARRGHPRDTCLRAPIPHLVLRLDKPATIEKGAGDGLPAMRSVTEIDLGDLPDGAFHIYADALAGGRSFAVTGRLLHARTDHDLRAVTLAVADIRPAHSE